MTTNVRTERKFETYSRGAELVRAIKAMWECNEGDRGRPDGNTRINTRIEALAAEYDLTSVEWIYWARIAMGLTKPNQLYLCRGLPTHWVATDANNQPWLFPAVAGGWKHRTRFVSHLEALIETDNLYATGTGWCKSEEGSP